MTIEDRTVAEAGEGATGHAAGRAEVDRSAPPRLLALRLQGFKSFAERTLVEFGGGISAVVGPNGSGKSNLADGLRWALGEQGRALRSRRSEDVIWAGSEKRAAQGMADVTLVLDNADGLLPVDYQVLELGRRLYRSGENDYLLNKQRVRLRDLVDLLDAAHLADNAFLFIGQGMVDQALALRPEERRPLFEEVAGVRRHERRRRKAEEQLTESEANLARIEDILAELWPQARRLAAQAEQQATRLDAGDELAEALLLAAHSRWYVAAARCVETGLGRDRSRIEADRAMAALQSAEEIVGTLAGELAARAVAERERREVHDGAKADLTALELRAGRLASELEATARDATRLADERSNAEADLAVQRRTLSEDVPSRDHDLEAAVTEAERALADALAEFAGLQAARRARGEGLAAIRRAETARQAEAETARRRLADAERRRSEAAAAVSEGLQARTTLGRRVDEARAKLAAAIEAAGAAAARREAARARADEADAARATATERAASVGSSLAAQHGRLEALEARLAEEEIRGIARAAIRLGGRRIDDDLAVDPGLRAAVEAALADAARAYIVDRSAVAGLSGERGMVIVRERAAPSATTGARDGGQRRFDERIAALGGGTLVAAIRRDGTGVVRRILARVVWLPDLVACLEVQADLPVGWTAVARDGGAVVTEFGVVLGRADRILERRTEVIALAAEVERLERERASLGAEATRSDLVAAETRAALEAARADEARTAGARRAAEEEERTAARDLEALLREAGWAEAQAARLAAEVGRLQARLVVDTEAEATRAARSGDGDRSDEAAALGTWEARIGELRARRDRLAADAANLDGARRQAEGRRARAEATAAIDVERLARADREATGLGERDRALVEERELLGSAIAAARSGEAAARASLDEVRAADAADREGLSAAERGATVARERLRAADDRLRAADHADLEARLGLDGLREQLLVELAGLGELGIAHLAAFGGTAGELPGTRPPDTALPALSPGDAGDQPESEAAGGDSSSDETLALERSLAAAAARWSAAPPVTEPPTAGRLATLRRRYHELGAANPYAVEESAELRSRLATLEAQRSDLRSAIARTRDLIEELNGMIAGQFRATFEALEAAFATRFRQLFGGGHAKLSLTDPGDLTATGVEIVAQPPGKKAQALSMLSGGERALTAVALLFAMLEVRPVPFCVLDEVDAALDEANIGRFGDALRDLAHRTQFIVITHNRGTIESADALYGVTVGDDSVSRVISLRLDEAQALVDRRPGELAPVG